MLLRLCDAHSLLRIERYDLVLSRITNQFLFPGADLTLKLGYSLFQKLSRGRGGLGFSLEIHDGCRIRHRIYNPRSNVWRRVIETYINEPRFFYFRARFFYRLDFQTLVQRLNPGLQPLRVFQIIARGSCSG